MRKQWKSTMRHVKREKSCFQSGCPLQWQERLRRCCCECKQGRPDLRMAVKKQQQTQRRNFQGRKSQAHVRHTVQQQW